MLMSAIVLFSFGTAQAVLLYMMKTLELNHNFWNALVEQCYAKVSSMILFQMLILKPRVLSQFK